MCSLPGISLIIFSVITQGSSGAGRTPGEGLNAAPASSGNFLEEGTATLSSEDDRLCLGFFAGFLC